MVMFKAKFEPARDKPQAGERANAEPGPVPRDRQGDAAPKGRPEAPERPQRPLSATEPDPPPTR
jgi:hypothetical protein